MFFGMKKLAGNSSCGQKTSHRGPESCASYVTKNDLINIYNKYLKRYIEQDVLEEEKVQETICKLCREHTELKDGETVLACVSRNLNIKII